MRTLLILSGFIFCVLMAYGQQSNGNKQVTFREIEPTPRVIKLKEQHNAPEKTDFKSREAYYKAKKDWKEKHPEVYRKIERLQKQKRGRKQDNDE